MPSFQKSVRAPSVLHLLGAALALTAVIGCGGDGESSDPSKFIGTWEVNAGTAKVMCGGGITLPDQPLAGGKVTLAMGSDSPLVATVLGCMIKFDVKGNVATARPGQNCMTTLDIGTMTISAALTVTSATFTLSGDTGTLSQAGSAQPSSFPLGCPYQITATAAKTPSAT
jgi:hypothetical protein